MATFFHLLASNAHVIVIGDFVPGLPLNFQPNDLIELLACCPGDGMCNVEIAVSQTRLAFSFSRVAIGVCVLAEIVFSTRSTPPGF